MQPGTRPTRLRLARLWGLTLLAAAACLSMATPASATPPPPAGSPTKAGAKPAPKTSAGKVLPSRSKDVPAAAPELPANKPVQGTQPGGDYILVIVNREMITAGEVARRVDNLLNSAPASGGVTPPIAEIRQRALDALINERLMLSHARETGPRIDDAEIDRIIAAQAQQNQLSIPEFKERLLADGTDFNSLRSTLRDQLQVERVRDRELQSKVKVTDAEVDAFLEQRLQAAGIGPEYNIAQVLIRVPGDSSDALVDEKRRVAETALQRLKNGEAMAVVALELSEDETKNKAGALGLRTANRLPDVFIEKVHPLKAGDIAPEVLRTGAGFHVLQLVERRIPTTVPMAQTRASHILLRPSKDLSREAALQRLAEFRQQILSGRRSFESLAREYSQDGSAAQGGDLGWTMQGAFVPEFEAVMNELPKGGLSAPMVSRFGTHLIKVIDRQLVPVEIKKLRDMARNMLREQKSEAAANEWMQELRSRAFIEYREVPQ